jgi:hypothetical protein
LRYICSYGLRAVVTRHAGLSLLLLAVTPGADGANRPSNLVESAVSPSLTLKIDRRFHPLPSLRFPIENLTNAERRIFVEPGAGRTIKRLVIIQFEHAQHGSDFRFRYPSRPPRRFGAETYRFGTYVYDDQRSAAAEPAKEASRTRSFLAAAGYKSARVYRVVRLARVTDPQGLSEVIIFYMENADREYAPGPLPGADDDGDLSISGAEQERLFARMASVIKVRKG